MPMPTPPYSCHNFDEAIDQINSAQSNADDITIFLDTAKTEIENARTINTELRELCNETESKVNELESTICDLEDEIRDLKAAISLEQE